MDEQFIKKSQYDFHKYVMDSLQNSIRLADTKASLILAILGFVMPALINKSQANFHAAKTTEWHLAYIILLAIATVAYLTAFGFAIAVFRPRLPTQINKGFIFFQDILGHGSAGAYLEEAKKVSPDLLLESVLYQNWVLSKIVSRKFRYLNYAICASIIGLGLGILCILWIPS